MNNAVKFAKEIYRKIKARQKSKSTYLKNDYAKSIKADYKELIYYCKIKKIDIQEVWDRVVAELIEGID